jgi:hypothetical protein
LGDEKMVPEWGLKGTLGAIAALPALSVVSELERSLEVGDTSAIASLTDQCRREIAIIIDSAEHLKTVRSKWVATEDKPFPTESVVGVVTKLDGAIRNNNLAVGTYCDELKDVLNEAGLERELVWLEQSAHRFDFADAAAALSTIMIRLNIDYSYEVENECTAATNSDR